MKYFQFVLLAFFVLVLIGCKDGNHPNNLDNGYDSSVYEGNLKYYTVNKTGSILLDDLLDNTVYVAAVNKKAGFVNYQNAGGVSSYTLNGTKYQVQNSGRSVNSMTNTGLEKNEWYYEYGDAVPVITEKPGVSEFNSNPPKIQKTDNARSAYTQAYTTVYKEPSVGDVKLFWLDDAERPYAWKQKQAVCAAISGYAVVWVLESNFDNNSTSSVDNKLTTAQARAIANKFDKIYSYTTPIFGYEYGGDPASSQQGGVDGDKKVHILVYDIGAYGASGGTIGYFWSKDHYSDDYLASLGYNYKSNNAEIFYINSYWADSKPDMVYSTLIHEFIHMINFNEKVIKNNKSYSTWYTEMLAMLGEDLIGPMIGIDIDNDSHPVSMRMPYALGLYTCDPFFWSGSKSYGVTFGYGAYLARNYGGAAIIREIALNNQVNMDSINAALSLYSLSWNFTHTVERYHEAYINNSIDSNGSASFNKTVSSVIAGKKYTFYGFDIYDMERVNVAQGVSYISFWKSNEKGPFVYGLTQNFYLDYYSFILMSCADWQKASGIMEVDVVKPLSSNVNMHLIVK